MRSLPAVPLVAILLSVASCAHAEFAAPDTATEASLRIDDLSSEEGDLLCAANRVELERGFQALKDARAEQLGVQRESRRWLQHEARAMNLSQASSGMSRALAEAATAAEADRQGDSDAKQRRRRALQEFDIYASAAVSSGERPVNVGDASKADLSWKAAQYAMVWTEFFGQPTDSEDRTLLLQWLTSRSADDIEVLRAYHEDFRAALRHACDSP